VADIGVGGGWSSIGMAQAYPNIRVDGYDAIQLYLVNMIW
jgi:tRNA G46 methylase TrmB